MDDNFRIQPTAQGNYRFNGYLYGSLSDAVAAVERSNNNLRKWRQRYYASNAIVRDLKREKALKTKLGIK